jgi:hypothetical protein
VRFLLDEGGWMCGLRNSRRLLEAVLLLLEGDVIVDCRRGHDDLLIVGAAVWGLFVLEALLLRRDVEGEHKVVGGSCLLRLLEIFFIGTRGWCRRVAVVELST